jgi:hypothetical protein
MSANREDDVEEGALVTNASDSRQVKRARKKEREADEDAINDMLAVLAMPAGERTLWRILGYCSTFESIFSPDPVVMAHRAGQQDVGHYVMKAIGEAQPLALVRLMEQQLKG